MIIQNKDTKKKPVWLYVLVAALIHGSTHISLLAQHDVSVSDLYLPTSLSIIFVHWLGPRFVLPIVFLNSVASSHLWGNSIEVWPLWLLYAIPEIIFPLLSWVLFRKLYQGKYWLPDIRNTILFLVMGVGIPAVIEIFTLQGLLLWTGKVSVENFLGYVTNNLLSEFSTTFCITLPVLYYFSPFVQRAGYTVEKTETIPVIRLLHSKEIWQMVILLFSLFILSAIIPFNTYWYVFGFSSVYAAIRFGFGPAIVSNLFILLVSYVLPRFFLNDGNNDFGNIEHVNSIFFGANFLFVFAAITGRVISDVKNAEEKLILQNAELEQINTELDRFVYSVSHDLSAPLKSILGLVNISRISTNPADHIDYLNRIETSVVKLELFISQILDYSRNKRIHPVQESIDIKALCDDILENLRHATEAIPVEIIYDLDVKVVTQDLHRVRIILNNLLSNAVKFQRPFDGNKGLVRIRSKREGPKVTISVEDTGEGIRREYQHRIFDMFYRGNEKSMGSGLGLYIAREVSKSMGGSISFTSEYGIGSVFSFEFPDSTRGSISGVLIDKEVLQLNEF